MVVAPSPGPQPTTPTRRRRLSRPSARTRVASARRLAPGAERSSRAAWATGRGRTRTPVSSSKAGSSSKTGIWGSSWLTPGTGAAGDRRSPCARGRRRAGASPAAPARPPGRRPPAAPRSRSRGTSRPPPAPRGAAAPGPGRISTTTRAAGVIWNTRRASSPTSARSRVRCSWRAVSSVPTSASASCATADSVHASSERRRCGSDRTRARAGGAPSSTRSSSLPQRLVVLQVELSPHRLGVLFARERVRQRRLQLAQRHALLGDHGRDRELRLGDGLGQHHERAAPRLDAREAPEAEALVLRAELDPARLGLGRHGRPRLESHRRHGPRPGRRFARGREDRPDVSTRTGPAMRTTGAGSGRGAGSAGARRAGGARRERPRAEAAVRARLGLGIGQADRGGLQDRAAARARGGRRDRRIGPGLGRRGRGLGLGRQRRLRLRRAAAQRRGAHRVRRLHDRARRLHVLAERPADLARRLRPLDERAHLVGELAQREGLEQERVGARPDHGADARLRAHRRQRDERHRLEPGHRAQRAQQALAVHVGHQDVAHDAVGLDLRHARERGLAVGNAWVSNSGARNARSSSRRTFGSSSTTIIRRGVVISWLASAATPTRYSQRLERGVNAPPGRGRL